MAAVQLIDVRSRGGYPVKHGERYAYRALRKLERIDAIGMHHWGPPSPSLVPLAGETVAEAAIRRARSVAYHVTCWREFVIVAWDFRLVTWHGNGLNRRSIGLSLAGNFPALEAERLPHHDDPLDFAESLTVALDFIAAEQPSVKYLLTHSQAANKPADPGELAARLATTICSGLPQPIVPLPDWIAPRPKPTSPRGAPWPAEWRAPLGRLTSPTCPA